MTSSLKLIIIVLEISMFCLISNTKAENHYVDSEALGNNDGKSWSTAWTSVNSINWNQINPGDTIFISGGTDSTVYYEILSISSDGTSDKAIAILSSTETDHNGKVIFDGKMKKAYGVIIESHDYIIVKGLHIRNYAKSGQIRIRYSTGALIEDNDIYVTGHGGIYISGCTNVIIKNNRITTPNFTAAQTDGIYSQLNKNNIYEGNQIIIINQNIFPHCDAIQMYVDSDITVRNNYIEQSNDKKYNAQGIYATNCYGTIECYNNIVFGVNTENALLTVANFSEGNANLISYHNTLIGGGWGTLHLKDAPNSIIKNNILVNDKQNGWLVKLEGSIADPNQLDFNLYFAPNSSIIATQSNIGKNWSEWKNMGFESNGINEDPLFKDLTNHDLSLSNDSPPIDSGVYINARYDKDKNGITRPKGNGYDMGALEFISDTLPPNPPQNVHVSNGQN